MRSYEAARGLFSFLGFCSWAVIVIGAHLGIFRWDHRRYRLRTWGQRHEALLGCCPRHHSRHAGLLWIGLGANGTRGVDSAEYSQQSLEVCSAAAGSVTDRPWTKASDSSIVRQTAETNRSTNDSDQTDRQQQTPRISHTANDPIARHRQRRPTNRSRPH